MRQDVSRLASMRICRVAILASSRLRNACPARCAGARDFKMSGICWHVQIDGAFERVSFVTSDLIPPFRGTRGEIRGISRRPVDFEASPNDSGTWMMTRGFLRLVPSSLLDFKKNRDARWEPRMICQWSSSFALKLARLVSPVSDSLALSPSSAPLRFFLRLLFCVRFLSPSRALPSHWSLRGPCSQGRLLETSSLASRLLSTFSSPAAPPPHLQLSLFLFVTLSSSPSSFLSHLNLPLSFAVVSPSPSLSSSRSLFPLLSFSLLSLSLSRARAHLPASVRELSYTRYGASKFRVSSKSIVVWVCRRGTEASAGCISPVEIAGTLQRGKCRLTSSRSTTGLLALDLVVSPVANLPNGFESRFTSFFFLLLFFLYFFFGDMTLKIIILIFMRFHVFPRASQLISSWLIFYDNHFYDK